MNVLLAINHPSQYHVLKKLADRLIEEEHKVVFTIKKNKDILEELMKLDGREYFYSVNATKNRSNNKILIRLDSLRSLLSQEITTLRLYIKFHFDFMLGTDIAIAHMSYLFKAPSFVFCEDDYILVKEFGNLAYPQATHIVSPYVCDIGKWEDKRIGYQGSQKTGYLHPNHFVPNHEVIKKYGLEKSNYYLIRLVSMNAYHDILHETQNSFLPKDIIAFIKHLERTGRVYITAQCELPKELEIYRLNIDLKDIHHVLYYADLFVGDSQSMAVESALLGTPTIRSNKWVIHPDKVSILEELENRYKLLYSIAPGDVNRIISKIDEIFQQPGFKTVWKERRNKYFQEATDLTNYLFWYLTNYPNSMSESIKDKSIIKKFHLRQN